LSINYHLRVCLLFVCYFVNSLIDRIQILRLNTNRTATQRLTGVSSDNRMPYNWRHTTSTAFLSPIGYNTIQRMEKEEHVHSLSNSNRCCDQRFIKTSLCIMEAYFIRPYESHKSLAVRTRPSAHMSRAWVIAACSLMHINWADLLTDIHRYCIMGDIELVGV